MLEVSLSRTASELVGILSYACPPFPNLDRCADQVPLPEAKTDSEQFEQLKDWLDSYKPWELFRPDENTFLHPDVTAILPKNVDKRLGQLKLTYDNHQALDVPDWKEFSSKKDDQSSPMKAVGKLLTAVIEKNVCSITFRMTIQAD